MKCRIRKWELSDAKDLAAALSNKKVQDNLRDGLSVQKANYAVNISEIRL